MFLFHNHAVIQYQFFGMVLPGITVKHCTKKIKCTFSISLGFMSWCLWNNRDICIITPIPWYYYVHINKQIYLFYISTFVYVFCVSLWKIKVREFAGVIMECSDVFRVIYRCMKLAWRWAGTQVLRLSSSPTQHIKHLTTVLKITSFLFKCWVCHQMVPPMNNSKLHIYKILQDI